MVLMKVKILFICKVFHRLTRSKALFSGNCTNYKTHKRSTITFLEHNGYQYVAQIMRLTYHHLFILFLKLLFPGKYIIYKTPRGITHLEHAGYQYVADVKTKVKIQRPLRYWRCSVKLKNGITRKSCRGRAKLKTPNLLILTSQHDHDPDPLLLKKNSPGKC